MAKRHTQRGSTSLAIKEMQIKTTMRFHLTLVRMAIIKKSTNNKWWRGCGEKGTRLHCWWECKWLQPLRRTVQMFPKIRKIELPRDPAIPLQGTHLEKTMFRKDTRTPMFTVALFTRAKTWKQPKCPLTEEWIKTWYMYTVEYYSATKQWNNAICSNMDGPRECHTEWSKSEKEKYHMTPLVCGV